MTYRPIQIMIQYTTTHTQILSHHPHPHTIMIITTSL